MYVYRINSTAGKRGEKATQKGEVLRQLIKRGVVQEVKVTKPKETKVLSDSTKDRKGGKDGKGNSKATS